MPPLHPPLMATFLGLFALMSLVTLIGKIRARKAFPSLILLISFVVFGLSTIITATQ